MNNAECTSMFFSFMEIAIPPPPPPSLYLKIKMSNANIALMNISLVIE